MATIIQEDRKAEFLDAITLNIKASVCVTIVKTIDPFRAQNMLVQAAGMQKPNPRAPFLWDMIHGWRRYSPKFKFEGKAEPETKSPMEALRWLCDKREDVSNDGLYIMQWPQYTMKQVNAMVQRFAQLSRALTKTGKRVVLIVPTDFQVPPEIREMVSVIDLLPPGKNELENILTDILNGNIPEEKRPEFSEEDMDAILNVANGLTAMEAETAFSRGIIRQRTTFPDVDMEKFIAEIAEAKTEAVKRSDVLELLSPADIAEIGGLDLLKEWTARTARCMTVEAQEAGVDRPRGVMLAGPPGCGKSLMAKAMASIMGIPLIKLDMSRVFSGIVGSSEAKAKQAMQLVSSMSPVVCMVDEIDKVFNVNSGQGDSGVGMRILGTLLTHMQESRDGVFWVFTANRVDGLPPELLRKGRLDELFSVSVPNDDERMEVLRIHCEKRMIDFEDLGDVSEVIERSAGFVPAEIEAAVKEAKKIAFANSVDVTPGLIVAQLEDMKPLSEAFADQFAAMQKWAEDNARPASSGPRPRARRRRTTAPTSTGGGGSHRILEAD